MLVCRQVIPFVLFVGGSRDLPKLCTLAPQMKGSKVDAWVEGNMSGQKNKLAMWSSWIYHSNALQGAAKTLHGAHKKLKTYQSLLLPGRCCISLGVLAAAYVQSVARYRSVFVPGGLCSNSVLLSRSSHLYIALFIHLSCSLGRHAAVSCNLVCERFFSLL